MNRDRRLRRAGDIERVRKAGRSWSVGPVVLYAAPNPGSGAASRAGFVTGKRIGDAVDRNRARRRLREAVRLAWPGISPGWDLLWIARPSIRTSTYAQIAAAVQECLRRARLQTNAPPDGALRQADHETGGAVADPGLPEHL